jgi:hypothetical protein
MFFYAGGPAPTSIGAMYKYAHATDAWAQGAFSAFAGHRPHAVASYRILVRGAAASPISARSTASACTGNKAPFAGVYYVAGEMYNDAYYLFDGYMSPVMTSALKYTTTTDRWTSVKRIPTLRVGASSTYHASAGTVGNRIYTVGALANAEAYQPVTDAWYSVNSLPVGGTAHAAAVWDTVFIMAGGFPRPATGSKMQLYQATTDTWNYGTPPRARACTIGRCGAGLGGAFGRQQHADRAVFRRGRGPWERLLRGWWLARQPPKSKNRRDVHGEL